MADLELALADLKQQVALRNALQQQINILAPKAAGAESLKVALRDIEAQVRGCTGGVAAGERAGVVARAPGAAAG